MGFDLYCPPFLYPLLTIFPQIYFLWKIKNHKRMKHITIILVFLSISLMSFAQTAGDALRYSYWQYGGSARYMGVGGSMGALGGDYSAIISNPASLATYRRSELTITPSVLINSTESNFIGNTSNETRTSGNVNQASIVFATAKPGKWKTVNFGLGYSRLADFSQNFNYSGKSEGSIANYFLELSQGLDPSQLSDFDNGLAYDTDIIYATSVNGVYENDINLGDQTTKFQNIRNKGSMGEMNISLGGNMDHKLYVGGSVGIPFVNFTQTKTYEESDDDNSILLFNDMKYVENLTTSGVGFNINLGAIYRINQAVRVGAAYHSPTWVGLTDSYSTAMEYDITYQEDTNPNRVVNTSESPVGTYEYRQRTPMRLVGNLGVLIKKSGFISAEVEWLDYSNNAYNFNSEFATSADDAFEAQLNSTINNIYQSAVNIKVGGEFVVSKAYRLRAGYALYGNPYVNNSETFSANQLSLGAGYRKDDYFVDIAYLRRTNSEFYQPYNVSVGSSPLIENTLTTDYIMLTLGFKFGSRD